MQSIIKKILFIIIAILVTSIILYFYQKNNSSIIIKEIKQIDTTDNLTGDWWFVVNNANDEKLVKLGISMKGFDFQNKNLIISNGREIKEMNFVRSKNFPFRNTHFAKVIFYSKLYRHTWFVYEVKKIEIYMDERYNNGNIQIVK